MLLQLLHTLEHPISTYPEPIRSILLSLGMSNNWMLVYFRVPCKTPCQKNYNPQNSRNWRNLLKTKPHG